MKNKSALLVMDVQDGIIDRIENKEDYLAKIKSAVNYAHQQKIQVIYVVVGFRADFPEISLNNKSLGAIKESPPSGLVNPKPVIAPEESDIVVIKHRISAFSGSDLEMLLRSQGIQHLIICGISTSGVVLSTVREAADKDFQLTIVSDLCADTDPEVNKVLLEKVFARQASVLTSEQWQNSSS